MYRVPQQLLGRSKSAVVKTPCDPSEMITRWQKVRLGGMKTVEFMEECEVDGKPGVMMEDLSTNNFVYVSPNTVRNGNGKNEPEDYLLNNKIDSIANFDELLQEMEKLYHYSCCAAIEINYDAIFFGVEKGNSNPSVTYKLVDLDLMCMNLTINECQSNKQQIKQALEHFVEFFVSNQANAKSYKTQINTMKF